MQRSHAFPVTTLALGVTLTLGAVLTPQARAATTPERADGSAYTFAVIGDVPYGSTDEQHFPAFVAGINADPDVRTVTHLGDIKSGSTTCDDARFERVRSEFDLFADPLVYTPGDNEWTDCHRANNGGYQPLERLAKVRSLFFSRPGHTLGRSTGGLHVQTDRGIPENVRYVRAGVSFATLHVVGSNDDLAPWTGVGNAAATDQQVAEERHRMAAAVANVRAAFEVARRDGLRAVVLQQQADMFDPTVTDPKPSDYSAFRPLVQALVDESRGFAGPVYLFNGDSHRFNQDRPLAQGSPWLSFYGARGAADNLRRITVDGSDLGEADWLKVSVHPHGSEVLSFEKVPGA
ncbi:MAG: hypothetical protein HOQ22_17080 [Nocardioidaceae bacterium]|nr:hypothetical protein [Nocardioidaceae bacterium]